MRIRMKKTVDLPERPLYIPLGALLNMEEHPFPDHALAFAGPGSPQDSAQWNGSTATIDPTPRSFSHSNFARPILHAPQPRTASAAYPAEQSSDAQPLQPNNLKDKPKTKPPTLASKFDSNKFVKARRPVSRGGQRGRSRSGTPKVGVSRPVSRHSHRAQSRSATPGLRSARKLNNQKSQSPATPAPSSIGQQTGSTVHKSTQLGLVDATIAQLLLQSPKKVRRARRSKSKRFVRQRIHAEGAKSARPSAVPSPRPRSALPEDTPKVSFAEVEKALDDTEDAVSTSIFLKLRASQQQHDESRPSRQPPVPVMDSPASQAELQLRSQPDAVPIGLDTASLLYRKERTSVIRRHPDFPETSDIVFANAQKMHTLRAFCSPALQAILTPESEIDIELAEQLNDNDFSAVPVENLNVHPDLAQTLFALRDVSQETDEIDPRSFPEEEPEEASPLCSSSSWSNSSECFRSMSTSGSEYSQEY